MKVYKPAWVNHNDTPICSIDVHPDGSRFATGGLGEDSGRIVIWNMAPVVSEEKEKDENVPRILCQLDSHLACVNCVRWSCSGRYLASGGDDKLVMIWSISKTSGGGGLSLSNKSNVESWRCFATLRGHHGDVLDMAWSPHDMWLATCSVDNTIIVWRMDINPPSILVVLRGHTGLVKGVSWDPVGKYLGSQSDDKSVRIWRTSDWSEEKCIEQPFAKCSGTTMVLRLSWSPDGQYLVTAHAMNGKVPIAQIIERDGWTYDKDFVGHHMAITCVRFSRYIMEMDRVGKISRACVCALGSRDRSVSVWITCFNRPVVVMQSLFNSPILDLAWGPGGLGLMACSGDGSVAYMEFTTEELGSPIGHSEKDQLFEKLYGKSSVYEVESNCAVLENPDLLSVKQEPLSHPPPPSHQLFNKTSPVISPFNQNSCASSCGGSKQTTPPTIKQIETRRADGKRRITPIFIPPPSSDTMGLGSAPVFSGDEVGPFGSDSTTTPFSSSVRTKSKIVIEKREDVGHVKKEIFNNVAPSQKSQPPIHLPSCQPNSSFVNLLSMTEKSENMKKSTLNEVSPQVAARVTKSSGGAINIPSKSVALPSLPPYDTSRIPIPGSDDYVTVANNSFPKVVGNLALVHCHRPAEPKPKWTLALGSNVVGVIGCRGVVGVGCSDGTLHIVSANDGSPLLPPVAFSGGSISVLAAPTNGNCLVLLTTDGTLYSWRIEVSSGGVPTLSTILSNVSMSALIRPSDGEVKIKDCFVTEACEPLVTLSTGRAYMYSLTHRNWLLLSNSNDSTVKYCLTNYTEGATIPNSSRSDLLPLRAVQTSSSSRQKAVRSSGLVLEASGYCTRSYLENQVSRALLLGSSIEYKCWLFSLVRFLLEQGDDLRLRSLCEELLGPAHSHPSTRNWQPKILGIEKHSLLDMVLCRIKSNLKMQRLYLEIKELLDSVKSVPLNNLKVNNDLINEIKQ